MSKDFSNSERLLGITKEAEMMIFSLFPGVPGGIRTPDLLIRIL